MINLSQNILNIKGFSIALVAHDSKKECMIHLVQSYRIQLEGLNIIATRGTGQLIQSAVGLPVTLMQSGPHGGDQQIGALVSRGDVMAVIFLRDPMMAQPHEPDISALLRICDVHNVPLATNLATAEMLLQSLWQLEETVLSEQVPA